MPKSLSARLYIFGLLAAGAVLILGALLLAAYVDMRTGFFWVQHSQEVMRTAEQVEANLLESESGQRYYLLTRAPAYPAGIDQAAAAAEAGAARLEKLTADNPLQHAAARRVHALVARRIAIMKVPLGLGRSGRFDQAVALISRGHGKSMMDTLARSDDAFMTAESRLLQSRVERVESRSSWNRNLLLLGVPALAFFFAGIVLLLAASIHRPIRAMLGAMSAFGDGDLDARAPSAAGSEEFSRLAGCYNEMADRLSAAIKRQRSSDEQLQAANAELQQRGEALALRSRSTELLAAMAHRMQACRTDPELTAVLARFLPQVLAATPGILYVRNNSGNMMVKLVEWGGARAVPDHFAPDDCWALRRGKAHRVDRKGDEIRCAHAAGEDGAYRCEPILAGGELVGLFYLKGEIGEDESFRLTILIENVALSLTNHQLQRTLREQLIRDPLTNLFNRRYMEEALVLEAARSARGGAPLGIVMCDVDHFKTFNDRFGHEAGDLLLQAIAGRIRAHFRDGDLPCRYGGEEFAIIAPGADTALLARRTEGLRRDVASLSIQHQGRPLGEVTMSFGVASWPAGENEAPLILRAADEALYEAKAAGRNRVVLAQPPALRAAAE